MEKKLKLMIMSAVALLMFVGGAQAAHLTQYDSNIYGAGNALGPWAAAMKQNPVNFVPFDTALPGAGHVGSFSSQTYKVDLNTGIPVSGPASQLVNASVNSPAKTDPFYGTSGTTPPGLYAPAPSWNDKVNASQTTTFSFAGTDPRPWTTRAIFADWTMTDAYGYNTTPLTDNGLMLTFYFINGATEIVNLDYATYGGFTQAGWTSDLAITGIQISSFNGLDQDYNIQNLLYNEVPEPSTFILVGAGLAGLVIRRRRNTVNSQRNQ